MWSFFDDALGFCTIHSLIIAISHAGMTVEVLGTVIGTAIQGQIVGMANAPCIPVGKELNSSSQNFSSKLNTTQPYASLEHTVSPRTLRHCYDDSRVNWFVDMYYPGLELFNKLLHPYYFLRDRPIWSPQELFVPCMSSVPSRSSVV